jgi:hypothetical protein
MDPDGGWDDGHFSFEYWPGDWTDPISYNDSPLLTDYADFSDWKNMSLKFELFVPSANPWMAGSMQLIVGGVDKISGSGAGVDIYGNTCAGANNTYFNGTSLPRGLYTPWVSTGSFDTGDEWITVTVPYSNFLYGSDGTVATGPALTADDFTSLLIFVWSGGNKGTECNPVIKIDNIRAVPNK